MSGRIVLHAPTVGALERARRNLLNVLAADAGAEVLIIANAAAVAAALATPDAPTDDHLRLCENTLNRIGALAPVGVATVPVAVLELARLQAAGWAYVRA